MQRLRNSIFRYSCQIAEAFIWSQFFYASNICYSHFFNNIVLKFIVLHFVSCNCSEETIPAISVILSLFN
jgi:hypothetical protein